MVRRFRFVVPEVAILPATCQPHEWCYLTVGEIGLYQCLAVDVWTPYDTIPMGSGGASPPFPISDVTGLQTALDVKAPLASPAFTGTPTGITKTHVGLGSVDNTADTAKPVSTAQQTALDLKAALANPTLAGVTLANATDVSINATTGSRIGQSGSKVGFFGVTPVLRPTAITQTYATASATHANVTQLAAPAGGTGATAGAYSTAANRDLMIVSINAARTDIANVKQVLNTVIDQLQALGLLQ